MDEITTETPEDTRSASEVARDLQFYAAYRKVPVDGRVLGELSAVAGFTGDELGEPEPTYGSGYRALAVLTLLRALQDEARMGEVWRRATDRLACLVEEFYETRSLI